MTKRITADHVKLKRAYEPAATDDGTRILIDRLWPRGVKKADAGSINGSRISRGHDPDRWAEFRRRYAAEVHQHPERALARQGPITSFSRLMTRFTTTRLRYGIFFWDEKQSERPRRLIDSLLEESDA